MDVVPTTPYAGPTSTAPYAPPPAGPPSHQSSPPNIVFVLTDDLSMDLLPYMPRVQQMERQGLTFDDYFVTDSLCCPSRASIFTGNYPHDTHIFNNTGRRGGFGTFYRRGEEQRTFAVALQQAGYRTAMMGKYLNGYLQSRARGGDPSVPPSYVPPGWDQWQVSGWGYPEFGYALNADGRVRAYGDRPSDYLTDVLARKGVQFIDNTAGRQPFFLELATFAPHSPYVPAPRYAHAFRGLGAPQPPSFDTLPRHPPPWLAHRPPLNGGQLRRINRVFRKRVQDVQAVDDLLSSIQTALKQTGAARNTYIVFSSDNGLHDGEYRLMPGKETAFDTDIRVPLVITGPGIRPGSHATGMAENVDLADTFAQLGGTSMQDDGHSLVPLFKGGRPPGWSNAVLVEHLGKALDPFDPDYQTPAGGHPTSYTAMRTRRWLYVQYRNGRREFYDLVDDPNELDNVYRRLSAVQRRNLYDELAAMHACHTSATCSAATHVPGGG